MAVDCEVGAGIRLLEVDELLDGDGSEGLIAVALNATEDAKSVQRPKIHMRRRRSVGIINC